MNARKEVEERTSIGLAPPAVLPRGATALLDGQRKVQIVDAFPEGSQSYAFPHYKVNIDGEVTVVRMDRVGVEPKVARPLLSEAEASLHLAEDMIQEMRKELSPAVCSDLNARRFVRVLMILEHLGDAVAALVEKGS